MLDLEDTIAAIATAPGAAGLSVVRLSGRDALAVADAVFEGAARLGQAPGHTLHHGWAVGSAFTGDSVEAGGRRSRLDEVVAAVFRAPRSYTREDVIEFSCHGGRLSGERVLAAVLAAGARLARPGEFTLRAFLNGRLDLAQAEAVADVIHAETAGAHALALAQLRGGLSRRLADIRERLRDAVVEVEARVDFAEDVGGVEVPAHVVEAIGAAEAALTGLLEGAAYARAVREGVRVALIGRPNVGKSSLFNSLLGERRAIVAGGAGTTRDLVSEAIEVAGVRLTLSDTAGLRPGGDEVESEGVARARAALEESAVVIWVVDGSGPLEEEDLRIAADLVGRRALVAINKRDLPAVVDERRVAALLPGAACVVVGVSATRGDGVAELLAALGALLSDGVARPGPRAGPEDPAPAVSNRRHAEALERAQAALGRARAAADAGEPGEIIALELRESLAAVGEVTGETVGEDVLERIFSRFCIGK